MHENEAVHVPFTYILAAGLLTPRNLAGRQAMSQRQPVVPIFITHFIIICFAITLHPISNVISTLDKQLLVRKFGLWASYLITTTKISDLTLVVCGKKTL
jgi:uncharacterized membrane protein YadS